MFMFMFLVFKCVLQMPPKEKACLPAVALTHLASAWDCDVTSERMATQLDKFDQLAEFRSHFHIPKMKTKPGGGTEIQAGQTKEGLIRCSDCNT